jgi:uncharacterized protein
VVFFELWQHEKHWSSGAAGRPKEVGALFAEALRGKGFEVVVEDTLDAYLNHDLTTFSVIVPVWTMGQITNEQSKALTDAVKSGVGLAGCHGGMCDSFRSNTEYQFMTGGQWVSHPGNDGVEYTVDIRDPDHFITQGIPSPISVKSEQYYLHVDPAVRVLATTRFPIADGPHVKNGIVDMPTIWTKYYGEGRVFYNALGHRASDLTPPAVLELITRGCLWAAHAEDAA